MQQSVQQQSGPIGHPQVQQRMAANRMPQQFVQQNQMRGQAIRAPIGNQQIISSAIPSGQPRVYMKAQTLQGQYSLQGQQQFDPQQQQSQQYIRGQTPSGPQLQFIRGPQWTGSQDQVQPQQHLASMRPQQHILVTTQSGQQSGQQSTQQ